MLTRTARRLGLALTLTALACVPMALPVLAAPASAPAQPGRAFYDRVVGEYLDGKWEDLEKDLIANKDATSLDASQRADVAYIRTTLAEGRPAWWKQAEENKKFPLRQTIFGRGGAYIFDPDIKTSVERKPDNKGVPATSLNWDAAMMDNMDHAEHGFTKGELTNLSVWSTFGLADSFALLPENLGLLKEETKTLIGRFADFRGNVTGAYYGQPRARRWAMWLALAYYMDKYAQSPTVNSRKALGAMFLGEILTRPEKYPSIRLPEAVAAEDSEAKLAVAVKDWIEKHPLTLAEDRQLREAIGVFAVANEKNVFKTGTVQLATRQVVALDPAVDAKQYKAARDAWVKAAWQKAPKASKDTGAE